MTIKGFSSSVFTCSAVKGDHPMVAVIFINWLLANWCCSLSLETGNALYKCSRGTDVAHNVRGIKRPACGLRPAGLDFCAEPRRFIRDAAGILRKTRHTSASFLVVPLNDPLGTGTERPQIYVIVQELMRLRLLLIHRNRWKLDPRWMGKVRRATEKREAFLELILVLLQLPTRYQS